MAIGLLGKKLGMTHIYDDYGRRRAVTAIQAGPCTVLDVRTPEQNGYGALQLGFETVEAKDLNKPRQGQVTKQGQGAFKHVREFRLREKDKGEWAVGQKLTVELFEEYELIDVIGISIGKGFQGGMKRWNWSGGNETHGSMSHRAPGASGSGTTPGRVYKGHHFPGHMGNDRITIQNLRIVRRDAENNLLLVEGSVPGAEQGLVFVRKAAKRYGVIRKPQAIQTVVEEEEEKGKKPTGKKK